MIPFVSLKMAGLKDICKYLRHFKLLFFDISDGTPIQNSDALKYYEFKKRVLVAATDI